MHYNKTPLLSINFRLMSQIPYNKYGNPTVRVSQKLSKQGFQSQHPGEGGRDTYPRFFLFKKFSINLFGKMLANPTVRGAQ
jgi:hypothetical protein